MRIIEKIRQKKQIVRAVIYARFSSDNQREESIDAQVRAIRDYAKKNSIIVVGEYIDKAKSAMTDNRPEFLRMVSDSTKGGFDLVLVHKLDRFTRNRQDSIGYRMELKKHGVSLVSVLEYLDDESPESLILESVLEAMAEYYSKNLAREVNKGMKENALKGLHSGGIPPLGYDLDPETKMLVINEKEAEAVRLTFKMFNEGCGYSRINEELNLRGYKTKVGRSFSNNSLTNVVRNEKYIGIFVFNKLTSKDHRGKRNGNSYKDAEDIIKVEGVVPPIITKEEFRVAQNKINSRKHSRGANNAKEVYLLSGKIVCGECLGAYAGSRKHAGRNKKLQVTYRCITRKSKHACTNKEVRREYLEAFVLDALSKHIFDDKLIDRLAESYKKYQESKSSDTITTRDDLKTRISEIATQIDNLVGVIIKSGSAVLAQKLSEIEVEKIYLEAEYNQICEVYEIQEITIEKLTESFDMARELLKAGELSATKKLIELYVDRVTVYKNHVDVLFKFHPDITFDNSDNVSGRSEVRETYTTVSTSMGSGRGKTRLASTKTKKTTFIR